MRARVLVVLVPVAITVLVPAAQAQTCGRTYTVAMATRAARATYRGTRDVSAKNRRMLRRFKNCQRNPQAKKFVAWYYKHRRHSWMMRRRPPSDYAVASWYYDSGQTASGWHAAYGFASLAYGFGTRIEFCYHGNCAVGVDDDHGPYVGGRTFDLSQNLAGALRFGGVDTVAYRIL